MRGTKEIKTLDIIASILVIVGALNWGLVGLFDFNLVSFLFGNSIITRIIYLLVGLGAIYEIFAVKSMRYRWACEEPPHHPARV